MVTLQIIGFLLYVAVKIALLVTLVVLIIKLISDSIENAKKQKSSQILTDGGNEENVTLPYEPKDTQTLAESGIEMVKDLNGIILSIKDVNKHNSNNMYTYYHNHSGNSFSGSYNSESWFGSNPSQPKGPFGVGARGDNLWDPVLLAILNESFTGVFE